MATDVLVKYDLKKNLKTPVCETVVWPLANRVKNLIEKIMTRSVRQRYGLWWVNNVTFFGQLLFQYFSIEVCGVNSLQHYSVGPTIK